LGENVVQGAVNPDEFYVFKPTLKKGFKPILTKNVGKKQVRMVYSNDPGRPTKNIKVPLKYRQEFVLKDAEILRLAKWACIVEDHYSKKAGHWKPMDLEWAKDGKTGKLFIVQARPETVQSQKNKAVLEEYVLKGRGKVLAVGKSVGNKIGVGKARVIRDVKGINRFKKGEVLITDMTDPDWEPVMKIAAGIVTNRGGRTCHAAIISRELGIPCVVGTGDATEKVKDGRKVTVSCISEEKGILYDGALKFSIRRTNLTKIPKTRTKMMLNVGNPDQAFSLSMLPNSGVGLAGSLE